MTDKKPQNCGTGYCSCIECPYDECVQDKGQCNNRCLMNKTTKALKLAEEAFEALVHTPIAGYIWTGKCNPALFAIREALSEQVGQEPVAWAHPSGGYLSARYMKEFATGLEKETYTIPLYAAPVRTKDLSDYEIADAIGCSAGDIAKIADARAAIAADREKNK